jgi:GNAT superfamily N-acetyltransferase
MDKNALGEPLADEILANLPAALKGHGNAIAVLAFADDAPVGLATCIVSFSTFAAKPILNLHDIVVRDKFRGLGIGRSLMQEVEAEARRRGCCKVTLEVADNNPARRLYEREGFTPSGTFMAKPL